MKTLIPTLLDASHTIRRLRRRNEVLEAKSEVLDIISGVMRRGDGCYASPELSIEERLDKTIREIENTPERVVDPSRDIGRAEPGPIDNGAPSPTVESRMVKTLKKLKRQRAAAKAAAPKTVIPPPDVKAKRKYKKRGAKGGASVPASRKLVSSLAPPAPTTQALLDGKADTVVGAIKRLLQDETAPFTRAELVENLMDDPDYKKLLEAEGGAKALENALYHWSNAGKLKKDGDNYTVTAAGKEWFGKH